MNTLIKIVYKEKASEEPDLFFLRNKRYSRFFRRCTIVSQEIVNKKFVVYVSVKSTENKASEFCVGSFSRNHNIFKVEIVS
jgi:hypothetical protein